MNEIFCGSSCVKFILDKYGKIDKKLNIKMKWISELAICLKKNGFDNIKLICFNSNLYNDYQKLKKDNINFEGFKLLKKCENINILINEIPLTKEELIKEIMESAYIILCVESSKLNHNRNMSGGHFIILNGLIKKKVKVIIPRKNEYEYKCDKLQNIIKYCQGFGAWRILIREENND